MKHLRRLAGGVVRQRDTCAVGIPLHIPPAGIVVTKRRTFVVPIAERRQLAGSIEDKRRPPGSGVVDRASQPDRIVRECLSLIVRARFDHTLSHRIAILNRSKIQNVPFLRSVP